MSALNKLEAVIRSDLVVAVNRDKDKAREVSDLFVTIYTKLGISFKIYETFGGTQLSTLGDGDNLYDAGAWRYFGMNNGNTYLSDTAWDNNTISVSELKDLVDAALLEKGLATIISTEGAMVITGGEITIRYKDSDKSYSLGERSTITHNVEKNVFISERYFLKNGLEAYERVQIPVDAVASIVSEKVKVEVVPDAFLITQVVPR